MVSYIGMSERKMDWKSDQPYWNFAFSVLFAVLLALSLWDINARFGYFPWEIPLFDAVLLALAVFRIVRLFSYDKIMGWFRDLFVQQIREERSDGTIYLSTRPYRRGPLRTMSDLLQCPWCTGVWAALVVLWTYFALPFAWYIILLLALAGVGSFIQLAANAIGWRAENLKLDAHAKGSEGLK